MEGEGREGYDMTCEAEINGKRAEEMAAEICLSLGYSVTHSASQNSTTGIAYKAGEVDVFAIVISGSWYVVPSGAISRDDGSVPNDIRIVSIYPFIDAWHLLNGAKHMSERQLGFDF
jgi:hypothetical protein